MSELATQDIKIMVIELTGMPKRDANITFKGLA